MLWTALRRSSWRNGGFHAILYLLPLAVLLAVLAGLRFHGTMQAVQEANLELAGATANSFGNYLDHIWDTETALGNFIVETSPPVETINGLFTQQLSANRSVRHLLLLDPNGRVTASSDPKAIGVSFADRWFIRQLMRGQEHSVSDLVTGRVSLEPTLVVGVAIRQGAVLRALVCASVDVTRLATQLPTRVGEADVALVDSDGLIVHHSRFSQIPYEKRHAKPTSPIWEALRGSVGQSSHFVAQPDSSVRIGVAVPIPEVGWAAIASVSRSEALGPAYRSATVGLLGLLLVVAVTAIGGFLLHRELRTHSAGLRQAAASFADGHYDARVDVTSHDELAHAEEAFNQMAERVQELEHERLRFIQVAAHELRTPMTSIKGICSLLGRHLQSDPKTESLAWILNAEVDHLSGLVNDILDSFLCEEGRFMLNLESIDLVKLIEAALRTFEAAEPSRFSLRTTSDSIMVSGDAKRLRQVFKNIYSNSVKYSRPGTLIESVISTDEYFAVVAVSDVGRGIPADQLQRVFDPFFRATNVEDTSDLGGIGLGLNLCKDIIERHDGQIWVDSLENVGSTFYVRLPIIQ